MRSSSRFPSMPVLLGALLGCLPAALAAQSAGLRPRLPPGSDTASADAYFSYAADNLQRDPALAAQHFRWAALLDPEWAEPLDGWRAAVLIQDYRQLGRYMSYEERDDMGRLADSLHYQSQLRNPFQYRGFEDAVVQAFLRGWAEASDPTGSNSDLIQFYLEDAMRNGDESTKAWLAYSKHDLPLALDLYERAIRKAPKFDKGYLRAERAYVFAAAERWDEARAEIEAAVKALREVDEKELFLFYQAKELHLYSMGVISELNDDIEQARTDYRLTLEENLGFYPAHDRLAQLALVEGDTATALSEFRLSSELAPDQPMVRMRLAGLLAVTGDMPAAETELRAAVAANPVYAAPHLVLGALAESQGKLPEALAAYQRFLDLAAQSHPRRPVAQERVTTLKAMLGG